MWKTLWKTSETRSGRRSTCRGPPGNVVPAREPLRDASRRLRRKTITGACTVCGLRATEKHHAAPKGTGGRYLTVPTQNGALKLESALLALCHGCHDRFPPQGFEYSVEWRWYDRESCDAWWSGELLSSGIKPHSPELFAYGFYVVKADRAFAVAEL